MIADLKTAFIVALVCSLIFVQSLSSLNSAAAEVGKPNISSSIKHIKHRIAESGKCKAGLELVFKATNGLPACVSTNIKNKLIQRGWVLGGGLGVKIAPPENQSTPLLSRGTKFVPTQLIIKFSPGVSEGEQNQQIESKGAAVKSNYPETNVKILTVPEQALEGIKNAFENNPNVEFVQYDYIYEPAASVSDSFFLSDQTGLAKINAQAAWDINKGNSGVIMAVLDTGFDKTHPDLQSKYVGGYNSFDPAADWGSSLCGHGTEVAGVAAAATNNGIGIAGLAWNNPIMPIKVTNEASPCEISSSSIYNGIMYASNHNVKVVNLSFSIYGGDQSTTDASRYLYSKGGWVLAAAGNNNAYRSDSDNLCIISVAATKDDDTRPYYTWGPYVDFAAPGWFVFTTGLGGTYSYQSGTSLSAPFVSGLLALIFSQNPNLTPGQAYEILKQSSVDLGTSGRDDYYGWGRIDAAKALQIASGSTLPSESTINCLTASTTTTTASTVTTTTTTAVTSDTTAPTTTATPAGGTYNLAKSVTLSANEAATIYYTTDGSAPTTSSSVYSSAISIPSTMTLKFFAKDAAGNSESVKTEIYTINTGAADTTAPTVSITSPVTGTTFSKTTAIQVSISASDSSGISKVELWIDNTLKTTLTSSPYSYTIVAGSLSSGPGHSIYAKAFDIAGNMAQSPSISVKVNKK